MENVSWSKAPGDTVALPLPAVKFNWERSCKRPLSGNTDETGIGSRFGQSKSGN